MEQADWGKLFRWALDFGMTCCNLNKSESDMWHFLLRKTLGVGEFSSVPMKNKDFRKESRGGTLTNFSTWSRWKIWRALRSLEDKGLVTFTYKQDERYTHIIVVPGLVEAWKELYPNTLDKNTTNLLNAAVGDFMTKKFKYVGRRVELRKGLLSKQAVAEANEKSKEGREKTRQKRMATKELSVLHVFELMKDYCKEVGVGFFTPVFSKGKKGRTCGSCQNFLDAYEKEGGSADVIRHLLYRVCVNWYRFRTNTLRYDAESGNFVNLGSLVNPLDFFNYRNQIEAWLAANPDLEEEEGNPDDYVTIIDR